ncbi:MAG: hypothetical protein IT384_05660 [Deltaproteobacteria bacterium]|nr:hypothetical protein [Deltaproteobacteria bacterium]
MDKRRGSWLWCLVAACGGAQPSSPLPDAGGRQDAAAPVDGGTSDTCVETVLTSCPTEEPLAGTPCEGTLSCTYPSTMFSCEQGLLTEVSCPACPPPFAERCPNPFSGQLSGATLELGPGSEDTFRRFRISDRVPPIFGPQGFAMLDYRLHIEGSGTLPDCATARTTGRFEGADLGPQEMPVRVHCGSSHQIFVILPSMPCEFRDYPVELAVSVPGVASATASFSIIGGGCPR